MRRRHPLRVVCPGWRDPRNVGSVFRLADAAGLAGVVLAGTTPRPPNAKLARTARSTVDYVDWSYAADAAAWLSTRRAAGDLVVALEITNESRSLLAGPPPLPAPGRELLLVVGAEDHGVPPDLLAECDAAVHLPMFGHNSSMNVAVALGAAVYAWLPHFDG